MNLWWLLLYYTVYAFILQCSSIHLLQSRRIKCQRCVLWFNDFCRFQFSAGWQNCQSDWFTNVHHWGEHHDCWFVSLDAWKWRWVTSGSKHMDKVSSVNLECTSVKGLLHLLCSYTYTTLPRGVKRLMSIYLYVSTVGMVERLWHSEYTWILLTSSKCCVSCVKNTLQGRDIEETSPSPWEQYTGSRWLLLWNDWPWSFLRSYLWQLGEDAGHPDEISVLVQGSRTGCDMLAWLSLFVVVHFVHIGVTYQWWSWVRLAVAKRGLFATCASCSQD